MHLNLMSPIFPQLDVNIPEGWWKQDAQLDLDFANRRAYNKFTQFRGRPDSILTYSSPSPKMVYGDDGVLGYAPHNLIVYSQEFDNALWSKATAGTGSLPVVTANAGIAPDGTQTADQIVLDRGAGNTLSDSSAVSQNNAVAYAAGFLYTASFYVKAGTSGDAGKILACRTVDGASYTLVVLTEDWQRVTLSATSAAVQLRLELTVRGGTGADAQITALFWGAQLSLGSTLFDYVPTTSAAAYSLPIDHNPTTLAALGVLVEEQRTNLLLNSGDINSVSGLTITSNAEIAPNGTQTADLVTRNATSSQYVNFGGITKAASAIQYTFSVFAKKSVGDYLATTSQTGSGSRVNVLFNLANGTVGTTVVLGAFTLQSTAIQALDNGWYRCVVTFTTDTLTTVTSYASPNTAGNAAVDAIDSASNAAVYLWGAQLEAGAFATSYIPTVASQVTRAADQVSILTSAFGFSATEGTLVVDASPAQVSASAYPASFDDGTANEAISVRIVSSRWRLYVLDGGVAQANIDAGSAQAGVMVAAAAAWAENDFAISRNGSSALTDGSGTLPTVTKLNVGRVSAGDIVNGHIKRLTYWNTRKTNAELQGLTI